ncbi:deoxyribodipyrimidine photo-lyase [Halobacillus locisalis]|uniref:Deoxyribodipyrimidine photo-lyase n=1 Tax=Halobacillus locisalis TaxID=220753 RepID=A0A838CU81_9BACI|nr:deoxyribodipyrimidine photo-lyase [Halobacillus locisalis]MBA2175186.1 deoxyribodipyrimidine photo-lyase [Halobacillus locisalis]
MTTRVVWFRRDLRLNDHTALAQAINDSDNDDQLLLLFHIHPDLNKEFNATHDYFFQTLQSLVTDAQEKNIPIHFIEGTVTDAFTELLNHRNVDAIYFNKDESGFGKQRDDEFMEEVKDKDVEVCSFIDHHMHGAEEISKKTGGYYKVFTPYYKQWKQYQKPNIQKVDHEKLTKLAIDETSSFKDGNKAYDSLIDKTARDFDAVGEKAAWDRFETFVEDAIYDYEDERDFPAVDGTSQMSRFLRTGAISIRSMYHYIDDQVDYRKNTEGVETYISELAWRDFYNMIYHFYPEAKNKEMVEKYRGLPWNNDDELFEAWKKGQTGFPIIDAAMRQLNETGWMHNRLRMAVASFLTKDLLMDWRKGERYFAEQLIDYDPASNIGGWQWAASTGTDPVPYFRVFNPTRQSERFDPHGRFIKEWVPELENVPKKSIHDPSQLSEEDQKEAKCVIGEDYPKPIVDHKTMRERAIEMFKDQKDGSS